MLAIVAFSVLAVPYPAPVEHDFVVRDYRFENGQVLASLNLHCTTIGEARKDAKTGRVSNAVLIMHGTGGSGHQFLTPIFADVLFGKGQPLDATKYFIILPDA